jgi:hypothetical protein
MKAVPLVAAAVLAAAATAGRQADRGDEESRRGPDSRRHEGLLPGEVTKHEGNSEIYEGSTP